MYKRKEFHDCVSFHCLNILTSGSGHWSPGLRGCTRGCQPCQGHAALLVTRSLSCDNVIIMTSPKACISSWTRLRTAILSGILLCCLDFMLMNRQLKLYVFPSRLYLIKRYFYTNHYTINLLSNLKYFHWSRYIMHSINSTSLSPDKCRPRPRVQGYLSRPGLTRIGAFFTGILEHKIM